MGFIELLKILDSERTKLFAEKERIEKELSIVEEKIIEVKKACKHTNVEEIELNDNLKIRFCKDCGNSGFIR